ncbi:hypothetical protein [Rhizobium sp. K1/93]|uniref:hypothetical protein n=1 Tax=Rhizobium sp. K1/93 TaxID=2819997 RepID=UPI00214CBCDA|nr:hypothetical protein [Rhizobium sp. K1/93]
MSPDSGDRAVRLAKQGVEVREMFGSKAGAIGGGTQTRGLAAWLWKSEDHLQAVPSGKAFYNRFFEVHPRIKLWNGSPLPPTSCILHFA